VTVNNLNVVLTSDEFTDIQPGGFQYIDLRFGNKVFVNETPVEELVEPGENMASSTILEPRTPEEETVDQESE